MQRKVTGHLGRLPFRPRDAVDVQAARIDTNRNGLPRITEGAQPTVKAPTRMPPVGRTSWANRDAGVTC